jgi:hypothetical protein
MHPVGETVTAEELHGLTNRVACKKRGVPTEVMIVLIDITGISPPA